MSRGGRATEFVLYGLCGGFLGGMAVLSVLWYLDRILWTAVLMAAGLAFLVTGLFRERALAWLKEIWDGFS